MYDKYIATYAMDGPLGQEASNAVETRDWTASRIDIDGLYTVRFEELTAIAQRVENQGRRVTGLSEGDRDLRTTDDARLGYTYHVLQKVSAGLQIKTADQWGVFFAMTQPDAQAAIDQIFVFHETPLRANFDSLNQTMIGHRDAGRWDQLATMDLETGWPAAPTPPSK